MGTDMYSVRDNFTQRICRSVTLTAYSIAYFFVIVKGFWTIFEEFLRIWREGGGIDDERKAATGVNNSKYGRFVQTNRLKIIHNEQTAKKGFFVEIPLDKGNRKCYNMRAVRKKTEDKHPGRTTKKFFKKTFEKPLDKEFGMWYNTRALPPRGKEDGKNF